MKPKPDDLRREGVHELSEESLNDSFRQDCAVASNTLTIIPSDRMRGQTDQNSVCLVLA